MSVDSAQVVTSLLKHLDSEGIGVYSDDEVVPPGRVSLHAKYLPDTGKDDDAVALNMYDVDTPSDPTDPTRVGMLQVRCRSVDPDPLAVDRLALSVKDALLGVFRQDVGKIRVQRIVYTYGMDLGADDQHRFERSDNFRVILNTTSLDAT